MNADPGTGAPDSLAPSSSRKWRGKFDAVFALAVIVPTALATIYYGLVASDVYISESRFVVRNPQRQTQTGLGALLQGTMFSRSQDDTYSVNDFIRSRDALRELDAKLQVRQAFAAGSIDLFNRFPGLDWDQSFEAFHRHYLKHVGIDYDPLSSISVLRVSAYTAQDAYRINEMLLQMGERLVNNLNARSRQDLIEVATKEVRDGESRVRQSALALAQFRSRGAIFDPTSQSALQLQGRAKLQEELLAAEVQLSQVRQVSPNNPQVGVLASRVDALRKAVAQSGEKITGGESSFSGKSPDYDRLVLEKAFADRQLAAALTSLDTARSEAARKQLYLERLVQPNLPDYPVEPRRIKSAFTIFAFGLVAWGVLSLIVAGIKEHVD